MLGSTCSWFFHGLPGESWLCGPDLSASVATPPTPPVSLWTVAPLDQQSAEQVVQDISNATVRTQQGLDANQIQNVSTYGVPSGLIPNPSSSPNDSIPWVTYAVIGVVVVGLVVSGNGRRRR